MSRFFGLWRIPHLGHAGIKHEGKLTFYMPQIDVNKGAGCSKVIQEESHWVLQ